ncbi:MAG: orotate phosphoribosyltransferase [Clostridium sp.]|nr:orotate phosphoribosyltransferase [Clostridium sp.]MCM1547675.1 orotate phosphoribosyltransferase [Ruminococcus sp.]
METREREIASSVNKRIKIGVIPGHFATNHSHVNYYVDLTGVKTHHRAARETAAELAKAYISNTYVDTIICLEGTEMIGAFLARELSRQGHASINSGKDISVITPETNANSQLIFRDNLQKEIFGKQIILLISSASTGKTISRSVACLQYYNGKLAGISSIFSAIEEYNGIKINTVFTSDDIPNYESVAFEKCEMCKSNQKIDAIINSYGYSKI